VPTQLFRAALGAESRVVYPDYRQANSTSARVLPPLAVNSKSEQKVNSLPPLGFEPVIFGMLAHLSDHLAKSHRIAKIPKQNKTKKNKHSGPHLFQILHFKGHASHQFPDAGSQVKVQRFLGAYGHAKQNAQESPQGGMGLLRQRWVQQKPDTQHDKMTLWLKKKSGFV
jgi:hypothetical protein